MPGLRIGTSVIIASFFMLAATTPPVAGQSFKIPTMALLYKFAPNTFSEAILKDRAARQIAQDQARYLRYGGPDADWIFMFSEKEIKGREPSFAAADLLPVYKERLAAIANKIPRILTFTTVTDLGFIEYSDGALRQKSGRGRGPHVLIGPRYMGDEDFKLGLPPLGQREVTTNFPELFASEAIDFPESATNRRLPSGRVHLALDRDPLIGPLKIDRGRAEHLFKGPDCRVWPAYYLDRGLPPTEAERRAALCHDEFQQYTSQLKAEYDVVIEEVVVAGERWIVKARLSKARLYGSRDELLKTYTPDMFSPGVDVWQARAQEQAEKRREEQEAAAREKAERHAALQAERERKEQIREGLADADVIGIRLGMKLEEADAVIRKAMQVGWVADSKSSGSKRAYDGFRAYFRADGRELVTLFAHPDMSDRVLAVGRVLRLDEGTRDEDIVASLKEKYGTDAIEGDQMASTAVWASRVPATGPWKSASKDIQWNRSPCNIQFGSSFTLFGDSITIREGDKAKSGVLGGFLPHANTKEAEQWDQCAASVLASISVQREGSEEFKVLRYFLADLSAYQDFYLRSQAKPSAGAALPKL